MSTRSPFIETFTGVRFRPLAPRSADIRIEDIAHGLSNQCRYSGHVRHFYSVGEHSVRVSLLLAAWGHSPMIQLWGLLHDGSEAYLVDLPSPLKRRREIGQGYRKAERRLMRAVCTRFALPVDEPPSVKLADQVLLSTEVRDLMFHRPEHWRGLTESPLPDRIVPWAPKTAEDEFLRLFQALGGA